MEHILQFAISIDDNAIINRVQENAEKTITQEIQKRVEQCIFRTNYYGDAQSHLSYTAETLFLNWLDSHKEEIIQSASKELANKMIKTKAVKAAIENVLEGDNE